MTSADILALLPPQVNTHWLHARCAEIGECWEWQGPRTSTGYPNAYIPRAGGARGRMVLARRLAAALSGKKLAHRQPVAASCGNADCVRPDHMRPTTPKDIGQRAAQGGSFANPVRARRIATTRRAMSRWSDEQISQVRSAPGPSWRIAQETGMSLSMVKAVRAGRRRKDYASPWAGLGQRDGGQGR